MRSLLVLIAALPALLAADTPEPVPAFDPIRFFEGRTRGTGTLKIVMRTRQPIAVDGTGRVEPDGTLVLVQRVAQGDAPPRTREWRIRQVSPGRYAGTLSDAIGPVDGTSVGRVLTLRFPMKGAAIEQVLTLSDDGRSAVNVLTARKIGLAVARLEEEIVKLD